MLISIRLEVEDLYGGMWIKSKRFDGLAITSTVQQVGNDPPRIHLSGGMIVEWADYEYAVVDLDLAIRCERDPIKRLAYQILKGDPMALDAARDVLRC